MTFRDDIIKYVKKKYKSRPEQLWARFPEYTVFRHADNQKWFGIIMDVTADKLGLPGTERTDILNVKLGDPLLADILTSQEGYFRGYHSGKGNWVSILLDGTVPFDEICLQIDVSYIATASGAEKLRFRPAREWIIPANPKYYDVEHAFDERRIIEWKQGKGIKAGDTVFMYVAAPVSAILYKCRVTETDIPCNDTGELRITALMRIKLLKRYRHTEFSFERLKNEFGIFAVRGPRGIPQELSDALTPSRKDPLDS